MMPSPPTTNKPFTAPAAAAAPQDQGSSAAAVKCPRCDSPNTKFCYYNNYSLSQPRYFCKTCRRYWTKGGALRNVPVGGGCRKSKKSKSSSTTTTSSTTFHLGIGGGGCGGGGGSHNQFLGFNYPIVGDPVFNSPSSNIAQSIESLSSMNQDLHWKLQQQRLAMLFGGGTATTTTTAAAAAATPMMEPISFHHLNPVMEGPKGEICGPMKSDDGHAATAWFLESSSGRSSSNTTSTTIGAPIINNNININASDHQWSLQNWCDMQQFSALP